MYEKKLNHVQAMVIYKKELTWKHDVGDAIRL